MERVLFLVLFMISASAQADVVLSSPDRFNPWEEQYPHSTWGTDPAQVELKTSVVNRGRSLASEPAGPEADPFA
ncbi:hypothetical protein, partial [Limosilactobacillus reuteri]|uniref:hypothetical protein n=1 Tax=Limosilactobacillus reuteri TaxID=1598 RepID=UPI00207C583A